MPRLMSVSLTEKQVRDRTKLVTRRLGWLMLEPGDTLTLCKKVMGRRKGEPLVRIVDVDVVSVRRERLDAITAQDVDLEGFPEITPAEFIEFFCQSHKGCTPNTEVTRIEWRYAHEPALCGQPEENSEFHDALPRRRMRVIVKGHDVTVEAEQGMTIGAITTKARWAAGCGSVPFDNWEIRTENGILLDPYAQPGPLTVLVVNLLAGIGA